MPHVNPTPTAKRAGLILVGRSSGPAPPEGFEALVNCLDLFVQAQLLRERALRVFIGPSDRCRHSGFERWFLGQQRYSFSQFLARFTGGRAFSEKGVSSIFR